MRYRISGPRAALVVASCALLAASAALAAEPTAECQKACANLAPAGHVTATIEVGVPILSKIPYISKLFKNVGVGQVVVVDDLAHLPLVAPFPGSRAADYRVVNKWSRPISTTWRKPKRGLSRFKL